MKPPMILPWLARRHGVPMSAANAVWRQLVLETNEKFPTKSRGNAYYGALGRLLRERLAAAGEDHVAARQAQAGLVGVLGIALALMAYQTTFVRACWSAWQKSLRHTARGWPGTAG